DGQLPGCALASGREGMEPIFNFIDAADDQPFFIFYAPFLPHTPHNPPDRLLVKYQAPDRPVEVAKYYAMIEWLDETVGELLNYLDREGLVEDTIVLYAVDNGWIQAVGDQAMADTRSKMSPYDAGMRTPIMIRWPGEIQPGRDEETLVSTVDLVPTMLHAAHIEPPSGLPGIDLRDSEALSNRKMVFGALFAHTAVDLYDPVANLKYRYVVREDGWKLILSYTPNRGVPLMINGATSDWMRFEPELYNVIEDPYERNDMADERPELVSELRTEIEQWWTVSQ
ncbi:MAG: sulfatase-like hydrolase/transferase, partial [Rhodothermales bacterium]